MKKAKPSVITSEYKERLNNFKDATGIKDERMAKYLLESAEWDFDKALTNFQNEKASSEIYNKSLYDNFPRVSEEDKEDLGFPSDFVNPNQEFESVNYYPQHMHSSHRASNLLHHYDPFQNNIRQGITNAINNFQNKTNILKKENLGEQFSKDLSLKYPKQKFPRFSNFTLNDTMIEIQQRKLPLILILDNLKRENKQFYENTISNETAINIIEKHFICYFCNTSKSEGINMVSYLNIFNYPIILFFGRENILDPIIYFNDPTSSEEFLKNLLHYSEQLKFIPGDYIYDKNNYELNNYSPDKYEYNDHLPMKKENSISKLRKKQEEEFQEALMMDQAIEESKKKENEDNQIRKKVEEEEKVKKELVTKKEEEQKKVKEINDLKQKKAKNDMKLKNLPLELPPIAPNATKIAIRFPSGKKFEKIWDKNTNFLQIYNWIDLKNDENIQENTYILIQTIPKKEFSKEKTLSQEGLFPNGILHVIMK